MDAAASHLLTQFTDAAFYCPETKSHDGGSSCQHATKILSLEMLPEKETRSACAVTAGAQVTEVHSPVAANNSSDIGAFNNRSGWLVISLSLKPLST